MGYLYSHAFTYAFYFFFVLFDSLDFWAEMI